MAGGQPHDPVHDATAYVLRLRNAWREPVAIVRDGAAVVVCTDAVERVAADGEDGLAALDDIWHGDTGGFWIGALAYDLGRSIERGGAQPAGAVDDRKRPDVVFTRFATRTVFEPRRASFDLQYASQTTPEHASEVALGPMVSSMSRPAHAAAVARIHDHLVAGDCYQVNLTRRLSTPRQAEPRALFAALACRNPAPHAALIELGDGALVSASPERFLRIGDGCVETRPIKGTHESARALATSGKDHAEHVMIVDMARNDLGRVCTLGSVEVADLTAVEHHPGLAHLVSTVRGQLRADTGLGDVIRATFPPASITGAPKPRVMEIIDALEPVRRGYYCGAHGWIDADAHRADLAVTIRTFVVSEHGTDLGVGGGIVADSTADGEWHESCLKAARLLCAAGAHECTATRARDLVGAAR